MKKGILFIAVLITMGITAFGFVNWNNSESDEKELAINNDVIPDSLFVGKKNNKIFTDFIYDVGPRFGSITRSELANANFFSEYIGEEHAKRIVSYKSLSVIILEGQEKTDIRETGVGGLLNDAQMKLLQSMPYSTNVLFWVDYFEKNEETGVVEDSYWTPHLTIVPEKQAEYAGGKDALKAYLKEKSKAVRDRENVDPEKLQPAKLFFTVNKEGGVENVFLDRTSNYPEVDKTMIELISNLPSNWIPAENAKGEKVAQELVVSFGLMGC